MKEVTWNGLYSPVSWGSYHKVGAEGYSDSEFTDSEADSDDEEEDVEYHYMLSDVSAPRLCENPREIVGLMLGLFLMLVFVSLRHDGVTLDVERNVDRAATLPPSLMVLNVPTPEPTPEVHIQPREPLAPTPPAVAPPTMVDADLSGSSAYAEGDAEVDVDEGALGNAQEEAVAQAAAAAGEPTGSDGSAGIESGAEDEEEEGEEEDDDSWRTVLPVVTSKPYVRPEGVVCVYGEYGQLNNHILSIKGGMLLAWILNRTLVLPDEFGSLFEPDLMLNIHPGLVHPWNAELCNSTINMHVISYLDEVCKNYHRCNPLAPKVSKAVAQRSANVPSLLVNAKLLFRMAPWTTLAQGVDIETNFYKYLYPRQAIRDIVDKYVYKNFGRKPYAAVHLRWLEGACPSNMKWRNKNIGPILCSPPKETFLEVMNDTIGFTDMPLFVASDRQRAGVLKTYAWDYLFNDPCSGIECGLIDFEIAARSSFFVGVVASSASWNIARLRRYRPLRGGTFHPSVLSWSRSEKLRNFNGGHYLFMNGLPANRPPRWMDPADEAGPY